MVKPIPFVPRYALAFVAALSATVLIAGPSAQAPDVSWTVVHEALNAKGQALVLGDSTQAFALGGEWSCTLGPTSKQLPAYEARTTTCRKGANAFEFSVQCGLALPKDHVLIRFSGSPGRFVDFIDVACEFREAGS